MFYPNMMMERKYIQMKKEQLFILGGILLLSGTLSAQTTERVPLFESFTSSTCGPCLGGNVYLEDLFDDAVNEGKFTSLKYQMSWPGAGDPYFTSEAGSRRSFYGVTSIPRLQIDGGFNQSPTACTQDTVNAAYDEISVLDIDAYYQVDEASQTVDVQISLTAMDELPASGGVFLHVAIFENLTTGNIKSNGETEFEHVMKKMVPSFAGTYVGEMAADEVRDFDFSYTFNGDYILPPDAESPVDHDDNHTIEEFSDLGVVVWVQRSSNRYVFQSTYAQAGTSGIEENTNAINRLSVYPNPTKDMAKVVYSVQETSEDLNLIVTDQAGKIVLQQANISVHNNGLNFVQLDTRNWDNGIYYVTLSSDKGRKTEMLSVLH